MFFSFELINNLMEMLMKLDELKHGQMYGTNLYQKHVHDYFAILSAKFIRAGVLFSPGTFLDITILCQD